METNEPRRAHIHFWTVYPRLAILFLRLLLGMAFRGSAAFAGMRAEPTAWWDSIFWTPRFAGIEDDMGARLCFMEA